MYCWRVAAVGALVLAALAWSPVGSARAEVTADMLEADMDSILVQVVRDGLVDYQALQDDPDPLDRWLEEAAGMTYSEVQEWTRGVRLAFYINAYNAQVLRMVRDAYPIEGDDPAFPASSVRQIPGFWDEPLMVAGTETSLNGLERDILLPDFREPRIHFGLCRAAVGGAPLKPRAMHGADVYPTLDVAARVFLQSPDHARVEIEEGKVYISVLLLDRAKDFSRLTIPPDLKARQGDLAGCCTFLAAYRMGPERTFLLEGNYEVEEIPLDWSLNDTADSR